ncbi:MAG: hydantoinase/carbamoylase family amidase [Desulfovibrio sp.]|jgi:N-carbamoyl-L-amino-acid hydrolase|nr:hydantoinase/carbamoylase family amidase [Desulfovibrio sp.]
MQENKRDDIELLDGWFRALDGIGANGDGSFTRPGYTDTEDAMIGAVADLARERGFRHYADEAGNTFVHNGTGEGEYTLVASHLDSVIRGGKFDGVAGVLAGLFVLTKIGESVPVKVGIFRMEESSTFGVATVGSSLVTGRLNGEKLKSIRNNSGETLYGRITGRGHSASPQKIGGLKEYLELHIEQGRVLEAKKLPLGIVDSIAAPVRLWVTFTGRQDHSGATPMELRNDALAGAAVFITDVERFALSGSRHANVATVGVVKNSPNAFNVIPGEVALGVDIRGTDRESRNRVVRNIRRRAADIAGERSLACSVNEISKSDPVKLDAGLGKKLSDSAARLGIPHMTMPSGAGHDAMNFAGICPTGMLFVPCRDGISHNRHESAEIGNIVGGCHVLLEYLTHRKE